MPEFPSLPAIIAESGGYFGPLHTNNHNLYEEILCPGVLGEAVKQSISDSRPRPYDSVRRPDDNIIVKNLLGYTNLQVRCPEAKNLAYDAGIIPEHFPSSPIGTGINIKFLMSISAILANTKTFKITHVDFHVMAKCGSITQAIMQRPIIDTNPLEKRGKILVFTNFKEQDSAFGLSITYTPNLLKESGRNQDPSSWACINDPPVQWIDNRNERRSLIPPDYRREAFRSLTQLGQHYRQIIVRMMVPSKR